MNKQYFKYILSFNLIWIIFVNIQFSFAAPQNNVAAKNLSISENYALLLGDVKWFFYRLDNIAGTLNQMLPNVPATANEHNRSFADNTRLNLLIGVRHLLTGIQEISNTFYRSLQAEDLQKFRHIQTASDYLNDLIKLLKSWFSQLRSYIGELFRLYNYYIPEVLLGKCFGRYLIETYPNRAFYEYPFLLLVDIFEAVVEYSFSQQQMNIDSQNLNQTDLDLSQNEIPYSSEQEHFIPKETYKNNESSTNSEQSFFNLSDVLLADKDSVIADAINKHSWKKCIKLYTAESILRRLKLFFLN